VGRTILARWFTPPQDVRLKHASHGAYAGRAGKRRNGSFRKPGGNKEREPKGRQIKSHYFGNVTGF